MSSPRTIFDQKLQRIARHLGVEQIPTADSNGNVESPPPMDTSSVNTSTEESQTSLTNEFGDHQISNASTVLIQTMDSSSVNISIKEGHLTLTDEAEDLQPSKLSAMMAEFAEVVQNGKMDTNSVNTSTEESQTLLTNEFGDHQMSNASTVLIQTMDSSSVNISIKESHLTLTNEAEDLQPSRLSAMVAEFVEVVQNRKMDTSSVNTSTEESQMPLTNEFGDHQMSNASTVLIQTMDTSSVNISIKESQLTLTNEAEDLQLSKLSAMLAELVKKGATSLRQICACQEVQDPMPVSYKTEHSDDSIAVHNWVEGQRLFLEKKRKAPSHSVGELEMSFDLPNGYDRARNYLNKMKIPVAGVELNQYKEKTCQFSFDERLEGWKLECKSRSNGRFDMYYYHKKARKTFRSAKEVVNFIMYETYPKPHNMETGYSKDQELCTPWTKNSSSKSKKFKSGSIGTDHGEELNQAGAMKFFEDAYNNLLNYDA